MSTWKGFVISAIVRCHSEVDRSLHVGNASIARGFQLDCDSSATIYLRIEISAYLGR